MVYSYRFAGSGCRPRRPAARLFAVEMSLACACWSLAAVLGALALLLAGCRISPVPPVAESAVASVPDANPPAAGMPALTVADVTAGEEDGVLRFTVSLSAAAAEPAADKVCTQ